jgi:hypothetical protein
MKRYICSSHFWGIKSSWSGVTNDEQGSQPQPMIPKSEIPVPDSKLLPYASGNFSDVDLVLN